MQVSKLLPSGQNFVTPDRVCNVVYQAMTGETVAESREASWPGPRQCAAYNHNVAKPHRHPGPGPAYRRCDENWLRARRGTSTENLTPLIPEKLAPPRIFPAGRPHI